MDFDHYQQQQQLLSHITAHTASSTKKLEARLLQWSMSTEKEVASDLDLIHSILKHERACGSSLSSACAARIFYPQLAQLVIDQTNDKKTTLSYSLLVCMIDLVKHDSLTPSQSMHFIAMASSLWSHHKIYTCRKSMELCCRLVSRMPSIEGTFIDRIVAYIRQCRTHMTRLDVDKIRSPDYTEFFFEDTPSSSAMVYDRSTIRWLIQTTFAVLLKQGVDSLGRLMTEIKDLYKSMDTHDAKELLFDVCCANDDDTVQLLDTILSIYQQPQQQNAAFLSTIGINPHSVFLYFIQLCGNTHDIMVDLLLENDSEFIAYFHRYIIYATQYMDAFKKANRDLGNDIDTIQTIVANTLLVLEGDGFPYNAKPLIRRLSVFEEKLFED
ncbi:hypothetical protein MUCCIDRAFT_115421 [Mucor lusitanicus CBS 277.49]|uniref:Protein Lines N-terminal domain-containing protein n=2 Tax=Mucor circinelloides f. lusitanicus TaxID=29924 RepID=A0A168H8Q5_MUCCL|nr:hypothetical protein MUCCIDRAFT_115421 [Mucor lusitanicus CBS 277.49]